MYKCVPVLLNVRNYTTQIVFFLLCIICSLWKHGVNSNTISIMRFFVCSIDLFFTEHAKQRSFVINTYTINIPPGCSCKCLMLVFIMWSQCNDRMSSSVSSWMLFFPLSSMGANRYYMHNLRRSRWAISAWRNRRSRLCNYLYVYRVHLSPTWNVHTSL